MEQGPRVNACCVSPSCDLILTCRGEKYIKDAAIYSTYNEV
jgi:hypothetical protein